MTAINSYSGISCIGDVPWGSHFCQFYKGQQDLIDSLVPYFKAGLENNEKCLWVTTDPLRASEARSALKNAIPDLASRESEGQIEILDHEDWYLRQGNIGIEEVLSCWVQKEQLALQQGHSGLRVSGNTHFVTQASWPAFEKYESLVSNTFKPHRIIALCSYCLSKAWPEGILDVVRNHDFAVVRRHGEWEMIESAQLKTAKMTLHQLNCELEERVAERTAELEKLLNLRDEFLSVASHELKTPLAALKLQIDSILRAQHKKQLSPEVVLQRLQKVETQCRRLDQLVSNLLDVSRVNAGGMPLNIEKMNLVQMAIEVTDRFTDQIQSSGGKLTLVTPSSAWGYWDRMRIDQVLTNLLGNALKHAPTSTIKIEIQEGVQHVHLIVSDNGPGIRSCDQEKIFKRFTQLEESRGHGGFGLGLWIVQEIVQRLAGTIELVSEVGQGATFTIKLPRMLKN